jgi:predicted RNA-binding Zn ribbon-like protein
MRATRRTTGQELTLSDGRRWWFDSGSLAIDFAYTGAMGTDLLGTGSIGTSPVLKVALAEILHEASDLTAWLSRRFPEVVDDATDRDLIDARTLRESLARAATALSSHQEIPSSDIDVINLFAATPDIAPALDGGTRQAGRSRARASHALSVVAREAVELFAANPADRIRQCGADGCELIFYDESRSNNRRWCSMDRCGNRAKVRAHRARTS